MSPIRSGPEANNLIHGIGDKMLPLLCRQMSEPEPGGPWTDEEIRLAVDAYLIMLEKQERGESFVKSEIREAVAPYLPSRSSKAIELKWCNISAVLEERGMRWVDGYKPLPHLQHRLREIVDERLRSPVPLSEAVAARMRNTPQKDTPFETEVKGLLRQRGLAFEEDRPVAGVSRSRPDLLFPRERLAVYLDGCYWHWCPQHLKLPSHNRDWWIDKLLANVQRDRKHVREFAEAGWVVLRFWEHEEPETVAHTVEETLQQIRRV